MKNVKQLITCIFLIFSINTALFSLTIKLGSLAPLGSPWDTSLKQLAFQWNKISGGEITLKIYPGGIAGDENDMIRKIRIGQLDSAAITGIGLTRIFPGILAIQLPFLVRNNKELHYVLDKIGPYYGRKLEKKGFKMLLWSISGWSHFFSKSPIIRPDDLKKKKIFVWEGDADMVQTYKELGFHPVPLAATEIMTSLQNSMIDTLTTNPLAAASYQWFGIANHMSDLKWAPFIGGIIISKRIWRKIPQKLQPQFLKAIDEVGIDMEKHVLKADKEAITIMKKHGLKIHHVSSKTEKKWKITADKGIKKLIGKSVPRESYEKVKKYLAEYRKKNKK